MSKQVIIVGGGAAGMMAALVARRQGAAVTLLERNPRVGKKLLVTGNGRGNYTNIKIGLDCYSGNNPQFAADALAVFGSKETIAFFAGLGIVPKIEEQGKVIPLSEQASSLLDVLLYELKATGVQIATEAFVREIWKEGERFHLKVEDGRVFTGEAVIIATGGKAMPSTGSDGNGYALAAAFGHTVTPLFPALVQLKLEGKFFPQIQGVKVNGTAELLAEGRVLAKDRGDLLFANYGISGPPIFQLSREAGRLLQEGKEPVLKVNLLAEFVPEELTAEIRGRFQRGARKTLEFCLVGLVNKRLIRVLLQEAGFTDLARPAGELSVEEQQRIVRILQDWRFIVRGTKSWPSAQVTAGGVDTNELNPKTMESKLVKGLYFAGEIIDIDGRCGGFNLQWAWSSGFVAGRAAALSLLPAEKR